MKQLAARWTRDRERERERERHRERETHTHTHTHTEREREKDTKRGRKENVKRKSELLSINLQVECKQEKSRPWHTGITPTLKYQHTVIHRANIIRARVVWSMTV